MTFPTFRLAAVVTGTIAVLALAGCSGQSSAVGTWGESADGKPQLVLEQGGQLTGTDGCNRLSGTWAEDGDGIAFTGVASTLMACPDVDTWLLGLDTAAVDGDVLIVNDSAGAQIGSLARLSG